MPQMAPICHLIYPSIIILLIIVWVALGSWKTASPTKTSQTSGSKLPSPILNLPGKSWNW
uniref:ATPase subunit 8 n=1 Tax=Terebratulina retusa TaxID=7580 RepID=Q9T9P2_9BILA|nr:ATP synthase F0 subunit 8 [Terebratulina retusa]CAB59844.1 ATPase subunit 8 [Terebratulina retusa]